jgi:hypothetical protein
MYAYALKSFDDVRTRRAVDPVADKLMVTTALVLLSEVCPLAQVHAFSRACDRQSSSVLGSFLTCAYTRIQEYVQDIHTRIH